MAGNASTAMFRERRASTTSFDVRLRLFAQGLGQIIERPDRLARGTRSLQAGKCLITRPSTRGRSQRAVGVGDSRLDIPEEPVDLVGGPVEPRRQSKFRPVRDQYRMLSVGYPPQHHDGREHLLIPERV